MNVSERFASYKKAVVKLEEILKKENNDIIRDSAIKRFEFCFELSWKVIQDYLREKGILGRSPKDCFRQAFQYGLIQDNPLWLAMIDDRNLTVHTYEEELAKDIFTRLPKYLTLFIELMNSLEKNPS